MLQHCDDAFHVKSMTHKPWTDDSGSHLHHHGVVLAFVMCGLDRAEEHVWPTDQEATVQPSRHTHLVKSWHHSFHAEQQVTVSHLRFCVRTSFAKPHETLPVMQVLVVTDTSTISSGRVFRRQRLLPGHHSKAPSCFCRQHQHHFHEARILVVILLCARSHHHAVDTEVMKESFIALGTSSCPTSTSIRRSASLMGETWF